MARTIEQIKEEFDKKDAEKPGWYVGRMVRRDLTFILTFDGNPSAFDLNQPKEYEMRMLDNHGTLLLKPII